MDRELGKLWTADDSQEVTIFPVSLRNRESSKNIYEPSVVSIGPYHRGRPHLGAMQEKKWSFLRDFLNRTGSTVLYCVRKIKEVENLARSCYREPLDISSDDFVEMMVLDGCFILEYFNTVAGGSSMIEADLILLENQIPYFILETLLGSPVDDPVVMMRIAHRLTRNVMPIKALSKRQKIHHLLHLCHCSAVPTASEPTHYPLPFHQWIKAVPVLKYFFCSEKEEVMDEGMVWEIPCASELEEAGVKFIMPKQSDDITKITFQSGTLMIPRISVTGNFKPVFMNLIALEQRMPLHLPRHFSTYMMFLDKLVTSEHDVQILQKHGIIVNLHSTKEKLEFFFYQCGVGEIINPNHYLAELFKRLNKCSASKYHKYMAKLFRDHFNSPWWIIALIAATLLLCLTILQSFMSVYAYIRPPHLDG